MKRPQSNCRPHHSRFVHLPLAAAIHFACIAPLFAADADQTGADDQNKTQALSEITVTAQKRSENAQDVPIAIDALSNDKLTEMNVSDFNDYIKLLPNVSTQSFGPGFNQVYMRGVANGSNGNHSGPLPSVGVYLDEQPITTIQGAIDPHIYDIARIEALAGPQGTLYGASSEAGTLRIITNKPDPTGYSAQVRTEVNAIDHGGTGYVVDGYVNIPFSPSTALRVVGWDKREAGYIDNVFGTRTYPVSGITINNSAAAKKNYNDSDSRGGRAALKIDLDDNWSITPTVMGQSQSTNGIFGFDPHVGDLKVTHFFPETSEDRWVQSALTVQGKIGNFDIVYAAAHLNRSDHTQSDYTDYSYFYDVCCSYGTYLYDNNGNLVDPSQYIQGVDVYRKTSNELRLSSPKEDRFRFTVGAFVQQQSHDIQQRYKINNIADSISVPGWPDTWWLTKQLRHDNDKAIFGEVSYDITDQLTGTLGARVFHAEDSLKGFFGFGDLNYSSTGVGHCADPANPGPPFEGAPCVNLDKTTKTSDHVGRANLTYKLTPDKMIYATWSEGFRPGGINRRGTIAPYKADFLTNYEFGWKTEWMDHHLRWNGAVFQEDWKDPQIAYLGLNSLTEIHNAKGSRIRGFESNIAWAATYNLTISGGIALYHSEITTPYCETVDENGEPTTDCTDPQAKKGTQLPITAKQKGDITARYNFAFYGWDAYFQGAAFFEGRRRSELRDLQNGIIGDLPGYGTVDFSVGGKHEKWALDFYMKNAFDNRGQLVRFAECEETHCGPQTYVIPVQPRTVGVRLTRDF
jgi:outer membrane receptor protein involved in Fe transport